MEFRTMGLFKFMQKTSHKRSSIQTRIGNSAFSVMSNIERIVIVKMEIVRVVKQKYELNNQGQLSEDSYIRIENVDTSMTELIDKLRKFPGYGIDFDYTLHIHEKYKDLESDDCDIILNVAVKIIFHKTFVPSRLREFIQTLGFKLDDKSITESRV